MEEAPAFLASQELDCRLLGQLLWRHPSLGVWAVTPAFGVIAGCFSSRWSERSKQPCFLVCSWEWGHEF